MAFKKDDSRINRNGRPKGSMNKKNQLTSELIADILEQGKDKFVKELNSLDGKNYVTSYLALMEYQLPKLARSSVEAEISNDDTGISIVTNIITNDEFLRLKEENESE